jgi:hypothetical protein
MSLRIRSATSITSIANCNTPPYILRNFPNQTINIHANYVMIAGHTEITI